MNRTIRQMLTGAVLASSIFALVGCGGETSATVSQQTVAVFESTYTALSSAGISYAGTSGAKTSVVQDIVKANDLVYPYVTAMRQAAENNGTVSTTTFAAATVALAEFGTAINETGANVSIPTAVAAQ